MEESIRREIIEWNNRFPIDKWFREKYGVPFLSLRHLESNFLHQYFEYIEDKMFNEENENEDKYEPNIGDWLKVKYSSKKDSIERLIEEGRREIANLNL